MFKERCEQQELMDDLELNTAMLESNLKEIEMTNRWFGSQKTLVNALNLIFKRFEHIPHKKELTIMDLGCGSGDLLRSMSQWAKSKSVHIKLMGLDANPFIVNFAKMQSQLFSNISFHTVNVMSSDFQTLQCDIATLNSFCHHIPTPELIVLLKQLHQQSDMAIIINDLHRHWLPYFAIKCLAKLGKFTLLLQHDGPLSVKRAFKRRDFTHIFEKSDLRHYQIKWSWLFRWQVIIWGNIFTRI